VAKAGRKRRRRPGSRPCLCLVPERDERCRPQTSCAALHISAFKRGRFAMCSSPCDPVHGAGHSSCTSSYAICRTSWPGSPPHPVPARPSSSSFGRQYGATPSSSSYRSRLLALLRRSLSPRAGQLLDEAHKERLWCQRSLCSRHARTCVLSANRRLCFLLGMRQSAM
jgi:hypothetical protein